MPERRAGVVQRDKPAQLPSDGAGTARAIAVLHRAYSEREGGPVCSGLPLSRFTEEGFEFRNRESAELASCSALTAQSSPRAYIDEEGARSRGPFFYFANP